MKNIFFTSDTHFGHKNIIKYSKRPFSSVEEMDEALIKNWNSVVGKEDAVWHLGDFAFSNPERVGNILRRLNGVKHYIWGNHDKPIAQNVSHFRTIQFYKELSVDGQRLILMHYPILSWNGAHKGSWMLHGHCHGNVNYLNESTTRLDVGVDVHNYLPISFEEVREQFKSKTHSSVDHHT